MDPRFNSLFSIKLESDITLFGDYYFTSYILSCRCVACLG